MDAQGRFKVRGLLPGIKYTFHAYHDDVGGRYFMDKLATVSLEAGKTAKDLGDLRLRDRPDASR